MDETTEQVPLTRLAIGQKLFHYQVDCVAFIVRLSHRVKIGSKTLAVSISRIAYSLI